MFARMQKCLTVVTRVQICPRNLLDFDQYSFTHLKALNCKGVYTFTCTYAYRHSGAAPLVRINQQPYMVSTHIYGGST